MGFGDNVEAKDPKSVSKNLDPRNEECVDFYPATNCVDLWVFYNVETKSVLGGANSKESRTIT